MCLQISRAPLVEREMLEYLLITRLPNNNSTGPFSSTCLGSQGYVSETYTNVDKLVEDDMTSMHNCPSIVFPE